MSPEIMKTVLLAVPFSINIVMFFVYDGIKKKWEITLGDGYLGSVLLSCAFGVFGCWSFKVVAYDTDNEIMMLSLFFLAMSLCMVILGFAERIIYDEEGFYTGISFLKKEKYLYRDISSYNIEENAYTLDVGTELLEFRKLKENEWFMKYAIEQSQKNHNREVMDDLVSRRKDVFDENSHEVRVYWGRARIAKMAWFLSFVILLCMALVDVNENNAGYVEGEIIEWYCKGETWCFQVEGLEKELRIVGGRSEHIKNKINARRLPDEQMQIYYKTRGRFTTYLQVYYIEDSRGNVYVTFEEANAYDDWYEWILCVAWVAMGGFEIRRQKLVKAVIMNPQDYSEEKKKKVKKILKQYKI